MKLVITDLDNTLYDWVTYFANAFRAMVAELEPLLEVSMDQLLTEFKAVHQEYQNSEQPFAVLDLPCVKARFPAAEPTEILAFLEPALRAFRQARDRHLRLYPGVLYTLRCLQKAGITVVGHTEATAVNAFYRLKKLNIWHYLDHLYALRGKVRPHPVPGREEHYRMPQDYAAFLPFRERKPNPELLRDICRKQGVAPHEALYVGDSLTRDMSMARQAGVFAVWAKYGTQYDPTLWQILVRVTHWTDEDVAREARLKEIHARVEPDLIIPSFGAILDLIPGHSSERQPFENQAVAALN